MYEHAKIQLQFKEMTQPRICRWFPTLSYRRKFCTQVESNLLQKNYVIMTLENVIDEEKVLLGAEERECNFEEVKVKKDKRKREIKGDSLGYESEKKEERLRIKDKKLLRNIRGNEERFEDVKSDEDWRGMEARLKAYIKVEVDGLKTFIDSKFKSFLSEFRASTSTPPRPSSPLMTSISPTQPSQPASTLQYTLVDTTKLESSEVVRINPKKGFLKKKVVCIRAPQSLISESEPSYLERLLLLERVSERVDYVLSNIVDKNVLVIDIGNIIISRGEFDDLLGQGWVQDNHLNAHSVVLGSRKKQMPQHVRSFLYVSPNHEYYKRSGARNYTTHQSYHHRGG